MRRVTLWALFTVASACGGSSPPASEPAAPAQPVAADPAAGADPVAVCASVIEREAECTDAFVPMLVDMRIRLDVPAGIAEQGKTEAGRQALLAQAKEEWAVDSAEPKRTETCKSVIASMAPEELAHAKEHVSTCLAKADCGEFVACMAPFHESRLAAQKAAAP